MEDQEGARDGGEENHISSQQGHGSEDRPVDLHERLEGHHQEVERCVREQAEAEIERRLQEEAEQDAQQRRFQAAGQGQTRPGDDELPQRLNLLQDDENMGHHIAPDVRDIDLEADKPRFWNYCNTSFAMAAVMLYYALRTRKAQWYLALVYLSSSKLAIIIVGNACVAFMIRLFDMIVDGFLGGLRLQEAEGLQDFFRWSLPETCLALTMFRNELDGYTAVKFLCLVWIKSLHHVAVLRENHTRLTQEIVVPTDSSGEEEQLGIDVQGRDPSPGRWYHIGLMRIPFIHMKVLALLLMLQCLDCFWVHTTILSLLHHGPSVNMLFLFEATILVVSSWSHLMLWVLHAIDGALHVLGAKPGMIKRFVLPYWKEYKATFIFAVELQAQAVQFSFYVAFFGIVMTYYGPPINMLREVYISFAAFKDRLMAFLKYRRLMASMDRFANVTNEDIEEAGRVCIICRDEMTASDCKKLPICNHLFHKSCLREWLVQQQSCPTCRSDIAANEAIHETRQAARRAADERAQQDQSLSAETTNGARVVDACEDENAEDASLGWNEQASPPNEDLPQTSLPGLLSSSQRMSSRPGGGSKSEAYPALYRVSVPSSGAAVYNDDMALTRLIPYDMLILCLEESHRHGDDCLRIPDGWVKKSSVQRLCSLSPARNRNELKQDA